MWADPAAEEGPIKAVAFQRLRSWQTEAKIVSFIILYTALCSNVELSGRTCVVQLERISWMLYPNNDCLKVRLGEEVSIVLHRASGQFKNRAQAGGGIVRVRTVQEAALKKGTVLVPYRDL